MTCAKHNLQTLWAALRGQVGTPEHAALLADVRRCHRCSRPTSVDRSHHRSAPPGPPPVPRVRVEQTVREMQDLMR